MLFEIYCDEAEAWWYADIDAQVSGLDKDAAKAIVSSCLGTLRASIVGYLSNKTQNKIKEVLLILYGYVTQKHGMILDPAGPELETLVTDIRDWFLLYEEQLPYASLFSYSYEEMIPVIVPSGVLGYIELVNNGHTSDTANIMAFKKDYLNMMSDGIGRDLNIYITYGRPTVTTPEGFNCKEFILHNLHLAEVLEDFGLEIQGLTY